MTSSKALHRLATHPHEYARYLQTGQLPEGVTPRSPLITLLKRLSPRDLQQLRGVTVDGRLGYTGSRMFHWGTQALQWIAPSSEVFGSFPADSWRDKRFNRELFLEDLAECCSQFPATLFEKYPQLRRPRRPASTHGEQPADEGTA
jgi:hypothetical protein